MLCRFEETLLEERNNPEIIGKYFYIDVKEVKNAKIKFDRNNCHKNKKTKIKKMI